LVENENSWYLACPPYHIAFVIGGTSAESCLKRELASAKYLDALPTKGNELGHAFRDVELESKLLQLHKTWYRSTIRRQIFCTRYKGDTSSAHGASCPVGLGVSCSADRNIKGKINKEGIWLETLDADPSDLFQSLEIGKAAYSEGIKIDLNRPMKEILATFTISCVNSLVA
jgi:fumarate hydratase class I